MCITCNIINKKVSPLGGVLYADDSVILNHAIDVNIPGYSVLSTKRHIRSLSVMSQIEMDALFKTLKKTVDYLENVEKVEKVYVIHIGEETEHFHFHIFPRYEWMKTLLEEKSNDGALLFSYIRETYKEIDDDQPILEISNKLKNYLK